MTDAELKAEIKEKIESIVTMLIENDDKIKKVCAPVFLEMYTHLRDKLTRLYSEWIISDTGTSIPVGLVICMVEMSNLLAIITADGKEMRGGTRNDG